MSTKPVCACAGEGRNLRPCLRHFSDMSRVEQTRIMARLGISWRTRASDAPTR